MIPRPIRRLLRLVVLIGVFLPPAVVGPFLVIVGRLPGERPAQAQESPPPAIPPLAGPVDADLTEAAEIALGEESPPADDEREITLAQAAPGELPTAGADPQQPGAVTCRIAGPRDSILGDLVSLQAITTGRVTAIKWLISPAGTEGLVILDGGRTAVFSNRRPGVYRITVAVAGQAAVDIAEHEIEILVGQDQFPTPDVPPAPAAPAAQAAPQQPAGHDEPQPDLPELIVAWVGEVQSAQRVAEAHIVGGSFRAVAARIATGQFPEGADPMAEVARQAALALNARGPAWRTFIARCLALRNALRVGGLLTDPATEGELLAEIANLLARVQ